MLRNEQLQELATGYVLQEEANSIASDLLTARQTIEALTRERDAAEETHRWQQEQIARLTEQLREGQWVKCSEKVPEDGRYLIYENIVGLRGVSFAYYGVPVIDFDDDKIGWYKQDGDGFDYRIDGVTHWMPLPDAPEV